MGYRRKRWKPRKGRKAIKKWTPRKMRGFGFPEQFQTTLKYVEKITIDPPVGGAVTPYTFSANGLYDPNYSGGGHQPMYFDELMLVYKHYNVLRSKITWKILSGSSGNLVDSGWCAIQQDAVSNPSAILLTTLLEQSSVNKVKFLSWAYGSTNSVTLTKTFNQKSITNNKLDFDTGGTVTTNPSNKQYYHLLFGAGDAGDVQGQYCLVEIHYTVLFTGRLQGQPS